MRQLFSILLILHSIESSTTAAVVLDSQEYLLLEMCICINIAHVSLQHFIERTTVAAVIWYSFDSSFNRLPHHCCSHAEFQRIFIVQNVELYQYSTFIFVAFFRMQHYYGIHLAFLEL